MEDWSQTGTEIEIRTFQRANISYWLYHLLQLKNIYVFITCSTYTFRVITTINSDYFSKQHKMAGVCHELSACFL